MPERQRRRNAIGKDWQSLRRADTDFIGKRLAIAVFDFIKHAAGTRWDEIDFDARKHLAELAQEFAGNRDNKPKVGNGTVG